MEGRIGITIDPSGAVQGERVVNRSLSQIRREARSTRQGVNRLGREFTTTGARAGQLTTRLRENFSATNFLRSSIIGPIGLVAGFAILTRSVSEAISVHTQFEATISNLSAITGATGDQLAELRQEAKELGSTTTLSASQVAEAFKLIASAKPDLLENQEALIAVTKETITLAEAAGITLPEAAGALGGALNQFSAGAEEANRFINVLAAGSQKGAAEIPLLTEALRTSGTVAAAAGISFEETIASIEALAEVNIKGAEAGTGLRNILLILQQKAIPELDPKVQGLAGSLRNLGELELSTAELTKLFGRESVTAAQALLERVQRTEDLTAAITGTNIAEEQARINVDNLSGDLKNLGSAFEGLQLAVTEGADSPMRDFIQTMTVAIRTSTNLIEALRDLGGSTSSVLGDLSAASVEVIDRRLAEEEAKLEDLKSESESLFTRIGEVFAGPGGVFSGRAQSQLEEQQRTVKAIQDLRAQRLSALEPEPEPEQEDTARSQLSQDRINALRQELQGGGSKTQADKEATRALREQESAIKAQERAFASLTSTLDPIGAATNRVQESQLILNQELASGNISIERWSTLNQRLNDVFQEQVNPLREVTEGLEKERELIGLTTQERETEVQVRQAVADLRRQGIELDNQEKEALRSQIDELRILNEQVERQQNILQEIRGPQEEYNKNIEALDQLLMDGKISFEEFNEAVEGNRNVLLQSETDLQSGFERGLRSVKEEFTDLTSVSENAVVGAFGSMEDALVDFSSTGKINVSSLVDSILGDFARLQVRQGITAPLAEAFGSGASAFRNSEFLNNLFSSEGGGGLSGLFPGFQSGGSFTVPGAGGFDSRLVSFRATPGERVNVSTPGTAEGSQPMVINLTQNISTPDQGSFRRNATQVGADAQAALASAIRRNG